MVAIDNCFTTLVCWNLRQAYLLDVSLTQIPVDYAPLSTSSHVGFLVNFSSTNFFLWSLLALTSQCEVNLDGLCLFDQWELLHCRGHGPSTLCVNFPLDLHHCVLHQPRTHSNWSLKNITMYNYFIRKDFKRYVRGLNSIYVYDI